MLSLIIKCDLYCSEQINRVPENVVIPKGKYPIFFYGTHET